MILVDLILLLQLVCFLALAMIQTLFFFCVCGVAASMGSVLSSCLMSQHV